MAGIGGWNKYSTLGAFCRETGEMAGYALLNEDESWIDFSVLKTKPEYEKYAVNAALCEGILSHYSQFLNAGGIICDGARSISHETNFQDYLEKYFGFRKAYCRLHIQYNPKIKWLVRLLFPFRKVLLSFDEIGSIHKINSIMKMEGFRRDGTSDRIDDLSEDL